MGAVRRKEVSYSLIYEGQDKGRSGESCESMHFADKSHSAAPHSFRTQPLSHFASSKSELDGDVDEMILLSSSLVSAAKGTCRIRRPRHLWLDGDWPDRGFPCIIPAQPSSLSHGSTLWLCNNTRSLTNFLAISGKPPWPPIVASSAAVMERAIFLHIRWPHAVRPSVRFPRLQPPLLSPLRVGTIEHSSPHQSVQRV